MRVSGQTLPGQEHAIVQAKLIFIIYFLYNSRGRNYVYRGGGGGGGGKPHVFTYLKNSLSAGNQIVVAVTRLIWLAMICQDRFRLVLCL